MKKLNLFVANGDGRSSVAPGQTRHLHQDLGQFLLALAHAAVQVHVAAAAVVVVVQDVELLDPEIGFVLQKLVAVKGPTSSGLLQLSLQKRHGSHDELVELWILQRVGSIRHRRSLVHGLSLDLDELFALGPDLAQDLLTQNQNRVSTVVQVVERWLSVQAGLV